MNSLLDDYKSIDGLERMVSRQDSTGSVVMFFHDGLSQQIALETNAAGTVTSRYLVDAFGVPRGKLDIGNSTGRSYYMTDPRGNLTQMIGASDQAVKAVFAYDPYGKDKVALSKKLTAGWDSRLKFRMAPRDPKTGSYSLGARLMNPTINRFVGTDNYVAAAANLGLQVDPLTGNRYLYAGANPAGMIDDEHSWRSPCWGPIRMCGPESAAEVASASAASSLAAPAMKVIVRPNNRIKKLVALGLLAGLAGAETAPSGLFQDDDEAWPIVRGGTNTLDQWRRQKVDSAGKLVDASVQYGDHLEPELRRYRSP